MPLRLIFLLLPLASMAIIARVACSFHDTKKGPLEQGYLKSFIDISFRWLSWFALLAGGITVTKKEYDTDYSEYLGQKPGKFSWLGYDPSTRKVVPSTLVCNHVTWVDSLIVMQHRLYAPAMAAEMAKMPFVGPTSKLLDALYIRRGGTQEEKDKVVQEIGEH